MKKLTAILAGATALVAATTAHAAPTITYATTGTEFGAVYGDIPGKGAFTDNFAAFMVDTTSNVLVGTISAYDVISITSAAIYKYGGSSPIASFDLTSAAGAGGFTFTGGTLTKIPLAAGTYYLKVIGTSGSKTAGYAGTLAFTAAPEPAAWSLMIIGFGAVGFAMRRQRATYRVAYN
jgi:hypothetical protein